MIHIMKIFRTVLFIIVFLFSYGELRSQNINIVPLPEKMTVQEGCFNLRNNLKIGISSAELRDAAVYLRGILSVPTGYHCEIVKGIGNITLLISKKQIDPLDESYSLIANPKNVTIKANTYRGIINGISSLRQLLPDEIESHKLVKNVRWSVPAVTIEDKPAFHWRGLMMDVSRHFFDKKEVKEFLDLMALYKLNKFHWHLTDDQGWRIEIKKYPLLTRYSSWRKYNYLDSICMRRERDEKNSDFAFPKERFKVIDGDSLYGGYYTQDDIKDIVKYAAIRGIDVIPELDMPSHTYSMVSRYTFLACNEVCGQLCPGKDTTLEFCKNVYDEVFKLFPFNYVSIGGDEVNMSIWKNCKDCQQRIKDKGLKSEFELQSWFIHEMEHHFNSKGKRLIGWDEILEGGLSPTATVDWWRGYQTDVVQRTTAHGNEIILCPTTYCYFDSPQDNKTIQNIYLGKIVPDGLSAKQYSLIKGMQANIWAEQIPTRNRQQFMVYPRALALAEKSWTKENLQDWGNFLKRLKMQLNRLDVMKVNYRKLDSSMK